MSKNSQVEVSSFQTPTSHFQSVDHLESASLAQRVAAQKLVNEHEMGELFKVLALSRGIEIDPVGFAAGDRMHRL